MNVDQVDFLVLNAEFGEISLIWKSLGIELKFFSGLIVCKKEFSSNFVLALLVRNDFWIYKIAKQLAVRFEYVYFAVCHAAAILRNRNLGKFITNWTTWPDAIFRGEVRR